VAPPTTDLNRFGGRGRCSVISPPVPIKNMSRKLKRQNRKLRLEDRIGVLKALLLPEGFEVRRLQMWHYRIFGKQTVDYWPSRNKAWVVGTDCKAVVQVTPEDVAAIAVYKP